LATRFDFLVVVQVVLATDIFDRELNDLRKSRWNRAFSGAQDEKMRNELRATIVIEHIIQASDVSHTMQHWHIYRKWVRLVRMAANCRVLGATTVSHQSFTTHLF
jgi:hypothetical protein